MPVDKFGRRRRFSTMHVHRTTSVNKSEDFMLNIGSDINRSMGCVDLTTGKTFTLNLGDATNKIVQTKDQSTDIFTSQGLELMDSDNEPIFKFNIDGQNTMYKDLDCQQKAIKNLPHPIESRDAVTKAYLTQYVHLHRESRKAEGTIPDEPLTNIVLLRYNPRRSPTMLSMHVEQETGLWINVSCGYFAEHWKNFQLFIKDNCFMCRFTNITGGPWTRRFILKYVVFMHR